MNINQPILFNEIAFFVEITEATNSVNWVLIKKLNGVNIDWQKGFAMYSKVSHSRWIKIDWILSLVGVVCDGNKSFIATDINLLL